LSPATHLAVMVAVTVLRSWSCQYGTSMEYTQLQRWPSPTNVHGIK
jgi:hypothetical protein